MAGPTNRRMPLSCEPCRERKIRCPRNTPGTGGSRGPCETCVRRGVPASDCIYLRDFAQRQPVRQPSSENANHEELLDRIRGLEELLRRHVSDSTSNPDNGACMDGLSLSSAPGNLKSAGPGARITSAEAAYLSPASSSQSSIPTIGTLVRSKTGHERYEPFSSVWSSILKTDTVTNVLGAEADGLQVESEIPIATKEISKEDLVSLLPPTTQCDELKNVYSQAFAPLWHVLHDPTLDEDYSRFRSDPSSMPLSWVALLFAILSVAVTALDEDGPLLQDLGRKSSAAANVSSLTSRYRSAAMQCLDADHYLWRHNIYTLQTLIILIYGMNHSHGQSWALLGLTRNIALSLGCHIDPENFGLDIIASEERRRCWAGLNMLYTIQNTALGNIDATQIQSQVKLPLDVDDDALVSMADVPPGPGTAPSQMSYLLHKFRLYDICSRITIQLFSQNTVASYGAISALDAEISAQQDSWNIKYLVDSQTSNLPVHHAIHLNVLFGYSHQLFLLLHRPVLMQEHSPEAPARYTTKQIMDSRNRCIDSAHALLGIQRMLDESAEFRPFRWYNRGLGSFHAFHAAVLIAYICSTCYDLQVDVIQTLRRDLTDTVAVFERIAASGMSRICQKALPVLRKLSQSAPHFSPVGLGLPQQEINALVGNMQPQQWLSPSQINWNEWDFMIDGNMPLAVPGA
ncbi:hypothetical protein NA57DRAFT_41547 [Rhizodiscina lignyota]|uniref:Zn(2)-C6 fungal-type domain-containing protein n=1 Tax=Rhizodiscina lignyota TaxID=1504668 RepID=A0A9P4IBL4_9PEZI|nr:hypothetical protein NA57DRAFT_41547 [Rhizodiscina lignyota]